MSKIIYDIPGIDQLEKHFKPRFPWDPAYTSTNTYFDSSLPELEDDGFHLRTEHAPREVYRGSEPITLDFLSTKLVGKIPIETGRLEVYADIKPTPGIVPAIWWLSAVRYKDGHECILPEFDSHEFGTENEPGEMNVALHDGLDYDLRYRQKNKQFEVSGGEHVYWSELRRYWYVCGIDDEVIWAFFRSSIVPMYPIIWNAVPMWGVKEGNYDLVVKRITLYTL